MLGQWDRFGRRLPFETAGSLLRTDFLGISFSLLFQRGTNPNRNASHIIDSIPTLTSTGKTEDIYGNE